MQKRAPPLSGSCLTWSKVTISSERRDSKGVRFAAFLDFQSVNTLHLTFFEYFGRFNVRHCDEFQSFHLEQFELQIRRDESFSSMEHRNRISSLFGQRVCDR